MADSLLKMLLSRRLKKSWEIMKPSGPVLSSVFFGVGLVMAFFDALLLSAKPQNADWSYAFKVCFVLDLAVFGAIYVVAVSFRFLEKRRS